jgi:four helix bundle protein
VIGDLGVIWAMKQSIIETKSFAFAVRMVRLFTHLIECHGYIRVLLHQALRSGTSIGANVAESVDAESSRDFISKRSIALKEARETEYWLRLLRETDHLTAAEFDSIHADCTELLRLLSSSLRKQRAALKAAKKSPPAP